jgi:hypothetical protein
MSERQRIVKSVFDDVRKGYEIPADATIERHEYADLTPELWQIILDQIATTEQSLHTLCKIHNVNIRSIHTKKKKDPEMLRDYLDAKEIQADLMANNIIAIADDSSQDLLGYDKNENPIENKEFTKRSQIRVETRQWLMERTAPKYNARNAPVTAPDDEQQVEYDVVSRLYDNPVQVATNGN